MTTSPETSAAPGTNVLPGCVAASPTSSASWPRRADGTVDWRKLVRAEHLYVKGEHKEAAAKLLAKPVTELYNLTTEDIAKIPDRMLVIRKAGILELARLRGYTAAIPTVSFAQRDYVIVETLITWEPFEGKAAKTTGGVGEANPENTSELGSRYLASNAQNRAFARAVRDYLEIDIVSSDELGKDGQEPEQKSYRAESQTAASSNPAAMDLTPQGTLTRHATEAGFSFEKVKQAAAARWKEDSDSLLADPTLAESPTWRRRIENDPAPWAAWQDVPPRDCHTLIALIKAAKAARELATKEKAAAAATPTATTPPVTQPVKTPAPTAASAKRPRKPLAPVTPISEAAQEQAAA